MRLRKGATGPTFAFREVSMVPRPRTRPYPPVVVACTSADTAAPAAERGLPMLLGLHIDDEGRRRMVDAYTATARNARAEHVAAVMAYVADTRAEAQGLLRAEPPRRLRPGLAGYVPVDDRPYAPRDPDAYAELLCRIHPAGTAEDCLETMTATVERTGIRHLILMVEGTGSPNRTRENHRNQPLQ